MILHLILVDVHMDFLVFFILLISFFCLVILGSDVGYLTVNGEI